MILLGVHQTFRIPRKGSNGGGLEVGCKSIAHRGCDLLPAEVLVLVWNIQNVIFSSSSIQTDIHLEIWGAQISTGSVCCTCSRYLEEGYVLLQRAHRNGRESAALDAPWHGYLGPGNPETLQKLQTLKSLEKIANVVRFFNEKVRVMQNCAKVSSLENRSGSM